MLWHSSFTLAILVAPYQFPVLPFHFHIMDYEVNITYESRALSFSLILNVQLTFCLLINLHFNVVCPCFYFVRRRKKMSSSVHFSVVSSDISWMFENVSYEYVRGKYFNGLLTHYKLHQYARLTFFFACRLCGEKKFNVMIKTDTRRTQRESYLWSFSLLIFNYTHRAPLKEFARRLDGKNAHTHCCKTGHVRMHISWLCSQLDVITMRNQFKISFIGT